MTIYRDLTISIMLLLATISTVSALVILNQLHDRLTNNNVIEHSFTCFERGQFDEYEDDEDF